MNRGIIVPCLIAALSPLPVRANATIQILTESYCASGQSIATRSDYGEIASFYAATRGPDFAPASLTVDFRVDGASGFSQFFVQRFLENYEDWSWPLRADATLTDLTTGSSLLLPIGHPAPPYPFPPEELPFEEHDTFNMTGQFYRFDETHVYRLHLAARSLDGVHGASVFVELGEFLEASACPVVPVPGSIVLAVLGFSLIGRWRRGITRVGSGGRSARAAV